MWTPRKVPGGWLWALGLANDSGAALRARCPAAELCAQCCRGRCPGFEESEEDVLGMVLYTSHVVCVTLGNLRGGEPVKQLLGNLSQTTT